MGLKIFDELDKDLQLTEILPLALTKEQGSMNAKVLAKRNVFLFLENSTNSLANSSNQLAKKWISGESVNWHYGRKGCWMGGEGHAIIKST